jgi:uncharacterized membrane protein YhaH (DUF805 family)
MQQYPSLLSTTNDDKFMTLTDSISACFSKYATFEGRASRSEYWWWVLFTTLLSFFAAFVDVVTAGDRGFAFGLLTSLATFVPYMAVAARRLHDVGRSGWWQLLPLTILGIVPYLYWMCKRGDEGDNRFGSEP